MTVRNELAVKFFVPRGSGWESLLSESRRRDVIKNFSRKDEAAEKVTRELEVFTEQDHVQKSEFDTRELYENLKERIINLADNITLNPRKHFVGFKIDGNTFCDVVFQSKTLKIFVNLKSGELDDAKGISRDVSNVGHWGNGSYEIKISDSEELEYVMSLIKQSLRKNRD